MTGKTKTEVVTKMTKLRVRDALGELPTDGNMRFEDLARRWSERVLASRDLAPSTRLRYQWALELVLVELGSKRLSTITVENIEDALDQIATGKHGRGNPLARSSMTKIRDLMGELFDFGLRRKLVNANPARLAVLSPSAARPPRPRRSFTPDEARKLWTGLEGERYGLLFRLQIATGMRPGEAAAVCWDAIDLEKMTVNVRRGVRREGGRAVLVETLKTSSSYRTLRLSDALVRQLHDLRRAHAEAVIELRRPRLLFPSLIGGPIDPTHVRAELARICSDLELPDMRPNELRHSAASLLNDAGVPLELIADVLGHKGTRMLDLHYRHRLRPSIDVAARVLGDLFEQH